MQALERADEQKFVLEIFDSLVQYLARWLECVSADHGLTVDGHLPEAVVQHEIGIRLKSWLPSGNLVQENQALAHDGQEVFIPDIVIERLAGGCWAVMEIKTMFTGDQLSLSQVMRDANKLCRFKQAYPEAHCIFLLVTTQKRLVSMQESEIWSALPLCCTPMKASESSHADRFAESIACGYAGVGNPDLIEKTHGHHGQTTLLDGRYIMVPTAESDDSIESRALIWEVGDATQSMSLTEPYQFAARMHRPSDEESMAASSRPSARRERAPSTNKSAQTSLKQSQESQ